VRRFKLEQNLAMDLLAEFDKEDNGLIGPLRTMAKCALEEIEDQPQDVVDRACRGENLLYLWALRGSLQDVTRQWNQLNAGECSDVIRLYGAVVEKGSGQLDHLKAGYRPGGAPVWEEGRIRGTPTFAGKPVPETPTWQKAHQTPSTVHGIDMKQAASGLKKTNIPAPTTSGEQQFLKKRVTSTVKKIDHAFGLPVGADISGTTADSIFFIERFARRCGIEYDPIYQLLALATLVSARHHALLEVALTLSLNKITNYSIGFYNTLMPPGCKHSAKGAVEGALLIAETHSWNKHILAYFDQREQIFGGYECEPQDLADFERMATTDESFLWLFSTMPEYPTKGRVRMLMGKYGLA
jgi:hypothetical protein